MNEFPKEYNDLIPPDHLQSVFDNAEIGFPAKNYIILWSECTLIEFYRINDSRDFRACVKRKSIPYILVLKEILIVLKNIEGGIGTLYPLCFSEHCVYG